MYNLSCCKCAIKNNLYFHYILGVRYSEWGDWGRCSKFCGGGNQTRTKKCLNAGREVDREICKQQHPKMDYKESAMCNDIPCKGKGRSFRL